MSALPSKLSAPRSCATAVWRLSARLAQVLQRRDLGLVVRDALLDAIDRHALGLDDRVDRALQVDAAAEPRERGPAAAVDLQGVEVEAGRHRRAGSGALVDQRSRAARRRAAGSSPTGTARPPRRWPGCGPAGPMRPLDSVVMGADPHRRIGQQGLETADLEPLAGSGAPSGSSATGVAAATPPASSDGRRDAVPRRQGKIAERWLGRDGKISVHRSGPAWLLTEGAERVEARRLSGVRRRASAHVRASAEPTAAAAAGSAAAGWPGRASPRRTASAPACS